MDPAITRCRDGRAAAPCVCGGNAAHSGQICAFGEVCNAERGVCHRPADMYPRAPVPVGPPLLAPGFGPPDPSQIGGIAPE